MPRSLALICLIVFVLACGSALAAPVLDRVDSDLRGALIPGSVITFTADGSPGGRATLFLRINMGQGGGLDWSTRMDEESPGHYVYKWETWTIDNLMVSSARVELKDRTDGTATQQDIAGFPAAYGVEIQGTVTDELTQLPVSGVQVMAYSPTTGHYAAAYSNAKGEYILRGLGASKDYTVWTRNDLGYTDVKRSALRVQDGSSTDHGDMLLAGLSAITGVVENEEGTPLPGATVHAFSQDGSLRRTTVTDQSGEYTLPGLPSGSYDLFSALGPDQSIRMTAETIAGKKSVVNFRFILSGEIISSYRIKIPDVGGAGELMMWPIQGGPVRNVPFVNGEADLQQIQAGATWAVAVESPGHVDTFYRLIVADSLSFPTWLPEPAPTASPATPQLTFAQPLTTRGGSTLLSGIGVGMNWVDLWLDGQWQTRLAVADQEWETVLSLDPGHHEVMAKAVEADALPLTRQVEIDRLQPIVQEIQFNNQPLEHFFSNATDSANMVARPKQALAVRLNVSAAGWTNWLQMGDRQWVMGRSDQQLSVTLPAEALAPGRYPLTWHWEKQGNRGEVDLGTLVVSPPVIRTVIDAVTGEPLDGVQAELEELINGEWLATTMQGTAASGQDGRLYLWPPEEGTFRLWLSKEGYLSQTVPLNPSDDMLTTLLTLDPIHISGPISLTPERAAVDISPSGSIVVAFDRDLDPHSVTPDRFYIQGVSGTITYDFFNRKVTLTPAANLADDTYYLVHLSGDIKYLDGTPLGKSLWWLVSTASGSSSTGDRSSASVLVPAGKAGKLVTRDSGASAIIPAGSSPVQTLYKLDRPSLPTALPVGWSPVAPALSFSAQHSPLERLLPVLRQGVELTINYAEPPLERQATALWYYDPVDKRWEQYDSDHDAYLRSVRFTTTRPGIWVFAKQQETAQR